MKRVPLLLRCAWPLLALVVTATFVADVHAQQRQKTQYQIFYESKDSNTPSPARRLALPTTSTLLAEYTFEDTLGVCDAQGWTGNDRTAQLGTFFHIDDFSGLGAPLAPLSGSQSLWCGLRAGPVYCDYLALPGYGHNWDQMFESVTFATTGNVTVGFNLRYDSEPGYDRTSVEYLSNTGSWNQIFTVDGQADSLVSVTVPADSVTGNTKIRIRFTSDGAWSDQDGLWDTDGACIIDDLLVTDGGGTVDSQNFETETPGDLSTADGDWTATVVTPFGDFAALYQGPLGLDPSNVNVSCFWGLFDNPASTNYSCGGYPGTGAIPYGPSGNGGPILSQYMWNEIQSPPIPFIGTGSEVFLQFDVYQDMTVDALVFFVWSVRFNDGTCWSPWIDQSFVYFGDQQQWIGRQFEIGNLSPYPLATVTEVQVSLAVRDMCWAWCGVFGTGACHTNSPLFDNVRIYRGDLGFVAGKVYSDVNSNCIFDGTDFPIGNRKIDAGGGAFAFTDAAGNYLLPLIPGAYTVSQAVIPSDPWALQGCQVASYNVNVVSGDTLFDNDFALMPVAAPQCSVSVNIVSNGINTGPPPCNAIILNAPCPGIEHEFCFVVKSEPTSTTPIASGTFVNISLDPTFTIGSTFSGDSTNCPITVTASPSAYQRTVRIDAPMNPGATCVVCVRATPALGGPYVTQMTYDDSGQCTGIKTDMTSELDFCSCDPNDKAVTPAGCGPNGNIVGDEPLVYKIRFENLGPGTAHNIFIEDQLDADLDDASFSIITSSHPVTGAQVEGGNVLVVNFDNIELPGTFNLDANKGYVIFSVNPKPGLAEGTVIENSAAITFDFNEPVVTNTTVNTIRAVPSPTAAFSSVDSCVVLLDTFDFTYTGGTADNATFFWDFGPDATPTSSTDQNPAGVTYASSGVKAVTLTVQRFGCEDTAVDSVTVIPCEPIPVLIQAFQAAEIAGGIELSWQIEADEEVRGFRIARRAGDGSEREVNVDGLIAPVSRRFVDADAQPGTTYDYVLAAVLGDGSEVVSPRVKITTASLELGLYPNHPNPFNPITQIPYSLDRSERVTLKIYDVGGRLVATLVDRNMTQGRYSEEWDGRDNRGNPVASGIYLYRLTAGKRTLTRKAVLLK